MPQMSDKEFCISSSVVGKQVVIHDEVKMWADYEEYSFETFAALYLQPAMIQLHALFGADAVIGEVTGQAPSEAQA